MASTRRLEDVVAKWLQGWTVLVVAAFVSKAFIEEIPWFAVAAVAGGHTALYLLLLLTNARRWRLEFKRQELERRHLGV